MEERLQKFMARCGVDSRRKCEELISEGRVEINGEIVRELGVKIDPLRDRVKVDGKILRIEKPVYYIHYKVKGVTTTVADDLGRKTVMHCLPAIRERVYPVGRLDKDTEGLLVFTNDGELANYLTQPAHSVEKTYRVVAEGRIDENVLRTLGEKGMRLGPVLVRPSRVKLVRYDNENTVVEITVTEGIHREVRRIFAALGHEAKKLLRIQQGPLTLEGLKRGATRALTPREIKLLQKGMTASNPDAETEMFPSGSAATRRPTGPRGRPRRVKAPRQGKPDPALIGKSPYRQAASAKTGTATGEEKSTKSPRSAKPSRTPKLSRSTKTPRHGTPLKSSPNKSGKGKVVVDDWKKSATEGNKRRAHPSEPAASKPSRPLRPLKRSGASRRDESTTPPTNQAPASRPARNVSRPAKIIGHPLLSPKPARGPKSSRTPKPTRKGKGGK